MQVQELVLGRPGSARLPLTVAERLNCAWARVDDHQCILDLACRNGALLSHFLARYRLRACGLTNDAVLAGELRKSLPAAEVAYSQYDDIPWRDETFDCILISRPVEGTQRAEAMATELYRVLRKGGQLVLSYRSLPLLHAAGSFFSLRPSAWEPDCRTLARLLQAVGFEDVTWRRPDLIHTTLVARKALPF